MDSSTELLLALADDELVLGYRESEWTGVAPLLEEDVALSSIAQDEIGHARALYALAAERGAGADADAVAYDREPSGFLHARLCERPRGDWGEAVARRWLYETADAVRLEALARSSDVPLAQLVAKIEREETYHLEHANAWLERLAAGDEGRAHLQAGLEAVWADALGLWEPVAGEAGCVESGMLPDPFAALGERWLSAVSEALGARGVRVPAWREPSLGGRRGEHTPAFAEQYADMTLVRHGSPGAVW